MAAPIDPATASPASDPGLPRRGPGVAVVALLAAAWVGGSMRAEDKPASPADAAQASVAALLKDTARLPGLITLHRKDDKLHAEPPDALLGREFFVLTSISRGIGERSLLGGMSLGFGDDWVWQFRKVDETIQVVRRNVRFFATKGSPEEKAVDLAYTDSILFSLPIKGRGPGGGQLIDLSAVFLTDLMAPAKTALTSD